MSVFIIRPGDLVICIDADQPRKPTELHRRCKDRLREGAHYRVTAVVWLYGEKGLHLEGKDHAPTDGWRACRFRRLQHSAAEHACTERHRKSFNDTFEPIQRGSLIISENFSAESPSWAA